jgi:hypothetical protein
VQQFTLSSETLFKELMRQSLSSSYYHRLQHATIHIKAHSIISGTNALDMSLFWFRAHLCFVPRPTRHLRLTTGHKLDVKRVCTGGDALVDDDDKVAAKSGYTIALAK